MHQPCFGRLAASLCAMFALCGVSAANAACNQAVQGATIEVFSDACFSVEHLTLTLSGEYAKMTVDVATADEIVLSYESSFSGWAGGSGRYEAGVFQFGHAGWVTAADGYQVDARIGTATVDARVWGPGHVGSVSGVTGNETTGTFESIVNLVDSSDPAGSGSLFVVGYSAPYAQGPNGTASVYSTVSMSVGKVVYRATVTAVPEPSAVTLMALGLLGTIAATRRRA